MALGRLRHELEHARQFDRSKTVYEAIIYVQDGLGWAFQDREPPTRAGSASLYNVLPSEEDANRASARLTTAHFGPPDTDELTSTNAPLFRDVDPVHPETLSARLLAMAAWFPAGVAKVAEERGKEVLALLADLGPDAPAAWQILGSHPELVEAGRAALARCPTETEVMTAVRPLVAWSP